MSPKCSGGNTSLGTGLGSGTFVPPLISCVTSVKLLYLSESQPLYIESEDNDVWDTSNKTST